MELDNDSKFDIDEPEISTLINVYMENILPPNIIYDEAVFIKPQIKEQEYLLESSMRALSVAKAGYWPQVSINASYNNYYYHYTGLKNIPFSDQLNQNSRKTIGLTFSIPIFNRFQTKNNIRRAKVAIYRQQLSIEIAKKHLYKEICQAYANAIAAKETYKSTERAVLSSQKAFHYSEESYNAGKISVFEYNEAKTKYIQSLSEQVQAKFDFIFRAKILDFYNGIKIKL